MTSAPQRRRWLWPPEPAPFSEARERLARRLAWFSVAMILAIAAALAVSPAQPGAPAPTLLVVGVLPLAGAALWRRGGRLLRVSLPIYWSLGVALLTGEPFVTQHVTSILLLPPVFAAMVGTPSTVLAAIATLLAVFVARGGVGSPYLAPVILAELAGTAMLLVAAQVGLVRAMQRSLSAERRLAAIAGETHDALVIARVDEGGAMRPVFVGGAIQRLLGISGERFRALAETELVHPDDAPSLAEALADAKARPGAVGDVELRMLHAGGHWVWVRVRAKNLVEHPDVGGVVLTYQDVSQARQTQLELERRLVFQARHDPLTGLPNRRMLIERLDDVLDRVHTVGARASLLICDLDNFKVVNDGLGHEHGDKLLVAVGTRLRVALRPNDLVARLGGDEFVVLLDELDTKDQAALLAQRALDALAEPVELAGQRVPVTASVGVVHLRPDHERADDVIRDADVAMYHAKASGKGRVTVFEAGMRDKAWERHDLEQALRVAIREGQLHLLYQPKLAARDGALLGFEALVRWEHPDRGLIGPGEFIPLAEETGLIVPLGRWVFREACRQLGEWRGELPAAREVTVAVNLSGPELHSDELVTELAQVLEIHGVPAESLELEVTESVAMSNPAAVASALTALKSLGVRVALDDFGTGYSSLAYLRKLPVDVLKIDRAFVKGLGTDIEDAEIIRFLVSLAKTLSLSTVAEGVETQAQHAQLRLLGVDALQGYLLGRPMKAADAAELMARAPLSTREAAAAQ
jgi:diguanylate cyclase (GGDEF)-like protein/PAS domain S-box-containing protein